MADRNDDKFINIIKNRIAAYSNNVQITEEGTVLSVSDGIAIVSGLANVMLNEIVQFENNTQGIALNLEANYVGVVVLGPYQDIHENSRVKRMRKVVSVPVGDELLGRIVDPLGQPIDGGVKFDETIKVMPIEKIAPGVMTRKPVYQTLETGILMIDSMFPIGKGQRELIIGDRQTGKSSIAINTIINQKGKNVKCVYVSIGQKKSTLAQIIRSLETCGAMKYTTVVASTASDLPALLYLAPYSGVTIAEE
jgi:F-type H+-transporting ATPase subunit alpha